MRKRAGKASKASGPSLKEQRLFGRFPSRFPAKFKDTRNDFGTNVYLRDSSAGGVRIVSRERLYLNDKVTLEVELADGMDPLVIRGEVTWVRHRDMDMWDIGLRFHRIKFMEMWRLQNFVDPIKPN